MKRHHFGSFLLKKRFKLLIYYENCCWLVFFSSANWLIAYYFITSCNPCSSVRPGSPSSTSTLKRSCSPAWCCSLNSAPQRQPSPPLTWTTAPPTATTPPQDWSSTPTPHHRRPLLDTSATASPLALRHPLSPHPQPRRLPSILLLRWPHSPQCLPPRQPSSTTRCTSPTACSEQLWVELELPDWWVETVALQPVPSSGWDWISRRRVWCNQKGFQKALSFLSFLYYCCNS